MLRLSRSENIVRWKHWDFSRPQLIVLVCCFSLKNRISLVSLNLWLLITLRVDVETLKRLGNKTSLTISHGSMILGANGSLHAIKISVQDTRKISKHWFKTNTQAPPTHKQQKNNDILSPSFLHLLFFQNNYTINKLEYYGIRTQFYVVSHLSTTKNPKRIR